MKDDLSPLSLQQPAAFYINLFWERVFMCCTLTRLMLVYDVASDEVLARRMFPKADSCKGRLRVIKHLLVLQTVEEPQMVLSS